jgi:Tol biopolymer transport system component
VKRSGCVGFVLAALARAAVFPTTTCIAAEHPPTGAPQSHPPRQTCFGNWRVFAWRSSASSLGTATRESNTADADGTDLQPVDDLRGDKQTPNWSPDGRRIAFRWNLGAETNTPLAIIDADGSDFVNLTKITGLEGWAPSWSPDGNRLVTAAGSKIGVPPSLYVMNTDGSHVRRITEAGREVQ